MKNNHFEETLEKLLTTLSSEYYFDYYFKNFILSKGVDLSNRDEIIQNTIKVYQKYHPEFDSKKVYNIHSYFFKIVKNDKIIYFGKMHIYQELYKILQLINSTFSAQKLLNNSYQYPRGFAVIQSDLKQVKSFRKHYKNNFIGLYKIVGKGQSRFRYWLASVYIKNKRLTKFFTYIFLTSDLKRIKMLHNPNNMKLIQTELDFFLSQRTTISKVIKSFGILLYWEQVKFLKINRKIAEENTSHIIYNLFKENFNAEEIHKTIEIKSSLGYYPVFGASKNSNYSIEEQSFIFNKLYEEIQRYYSIDINDFTPLFEAYLKTPHIQFLEKYPVELFRLNPKYSPVN